MTTQHAATIQDGSTDLWRLGGSDLFLLADRMGRVVALHTVTPSFSRTRAQELLQNSFRQDDLRRWWVDGGGIVAPVDEERFGKSLKEGRAVVAGVRYDLTF